MSRYRKVSVFIWNDKNFNSLSDDGQLVFLFVLTHPHMTGVGAMRSTIEGLAAEKGWKLERLSKAFQEAISKGMIEYDKESHCLVLPKFIKHNKPESPNVITGWLSAFDLIPECDIKFKQLQNIKPYVMSMGEKFQEAFLKAFGSLLKDFGKSMPNQEQEQEQEQDKQPNVETHPVSTNGSCPYEKIKDLYHQILPELPSVRILTDKRKSQLKARWNQGFELKDGTKSNCLDFWEKYFNYIRGSKFLMGQVDPSPGRSRFFADLEWITNLSNFTKILEQKYHG